MMNDDNSLLKEEYFHLQKTVEDFDQRALTIKAWSVTTSMAGIAASFLHEHAAVVALLSSLASVSFWMIESLWKEFQQCYYPRIQIIETAFRSDTVNTLPLQITEYWIKTFRSYDATLFLRIMAWPHVALPHAPIVLLGVIVWLARLITTW
jgi:hypothetical protein